LLPRFIYKEYSILWNINKYVPGGSVIQFFPKENLFTSEIDVRVYLAILTSSFFEIILRIYSQVYGGGSFNLRINTLKDAPIIDATQVSLIQKTQLIHAYDGYLKTKVKKTIDQVVYEILKLTGLQIAEMDNLLSDLKGMADSAKKAAHPY